MRVYNDNSNALSIASITLNDPGSPYQLTVNGQKGTSFSNTKLLANDSLLILIEANLTDRDMDLPYVIEDQLKFRTNGNNQEVSIFSWGQDANYIKDSILVCSTTWSAGKPYVIYDNALVDSLCTLIIEPGARVFSHTGSQIFVKGTIQAMGNADERIVFTNDRFDGDYQTYAGQWGGITFLPGSKNNVIRFTDIRNAEIGIWLGTPDDDSTADLVLENSLLENMSSSALLSFTSDLEMNNCLLDNAGDVLVALLAGGNYNFNHNTLANYGYGLFKSQPTFYVTDQLELADGSLIGEAINLSLNNTIVWGPANDEIIIENTSEDDFNLLMTNNILRTTNPSFDGFNNILNQDPLFVEPSAFNYSLNEGSPAIKSGKDLGFSIDLLGKTRISPPDIGAYEKQ